MLENTVPEKVSGTPAPSRRGRPPKASPSSSGPPHAFWSGGG